MPDLTAADLARLDHLAEYATAGPWEPWYSDLNECREVGRSGRTGLVVADCIDEDGANFIAASRAAVPALVAAVRELARAIDEANFDCGCPFCTATLRDGSYLEHAPDCIVIRARALAGE